MKRTFLSCLAAMLCTALLSQTVITRISAGEDFYYYNNEIQTALNEANPGDTILLPGQDYSTTFTINTPVVLIGVGYDPESSAATGATRINGSLTINAPDTEVIGLLITSTISVNTAAVNGVVQRCRIENTMNFSSSAQDFLITECVFANPTTSSGNSSLNISNADNIEVNNSLIEIITAGIGATGLTFNNNVIFDGLQGVNNANFSCNIFNAGISVGTSATENDNVFSNNVVLDPLCTDDCLTSDIGTSNVSLNNLFLSAASVLGAELPDYPVLGDSYPVLDASAAASHCPVSQPVGVYGGPQPFKDGAIPINPHISSKTISGVSDTDQINVVVGVEAQDN